MINMNPRNRKELAELIGKTYGTRFSPEDETGPYDFICPECDEPILEEDWDFEEIQCGCPICEYEWEF